MGYREQKPLQQNTKGDIIMAERITGHTDRNSRRAPAPDSLYIL